MQFKEVKIDKLPEVVEVNYEIFDGMYEWPPYNLEQYKERFKNISPIIFVAEDNEKIVGDSISFEKDGNWYLWILGVLKEFRGQGVASQLLDLTEKYAHDHNYKKVTVKVYGVSKEMLQLMIKRGYQIVDIHKHEKAEYNEIILELSL